MFESIDPWDLNGLEGRSLAMLGSPSFGGGAGPTRLKPEIAIGAREAAITPPPSRTERAPAPVFQR